MRRLLLLIALVVDLTSVADAQTAAGSVTGRVLNQPDGYALPGSVVTLTGADGVERRIVTDEQGRFKIGELPAGRYDLIAAMPGFAATTRNIEIGPPGSLELVLDVAMDYACVEEGIRVFLPLEDTLGQSDLIAHVRIVSEGALQSWPTRPACLHLAREYAASIRAVVHGDARQTPLSSLPILIGDPLRFSAGAELIVFLNWSPAARRFVLSGGDAAVGTRDGRLVSDHATFADQAEDRWPPRHLTSFGAMKVESIIAGVTGSPSPCLPVVAAHLRSLVH